MDESPVYVKINRKIWHTARFRSLSPEAKQLFFYLVTCPHGNMLGLFVLRPGYALDDLQWGTDRESFMKPFRELLDHHLFMYDPENDVILDTEQILKHPPINKNVVTAAIKIINSLPKTPLFYNLKLLAESLNISFMESLVKRLGERLGESFTHTVTVTVTETVTVEGGVGETKPENDLPVDNSFPEPEPKDTPLETTLSKKENEKPLSQNTHGERWTERQGEELETIITETKDRYGARYHQQIYVWLQSHFNRANPDAVIYCLRRLIQERLAGKQIPAPGRWLDSVMAVENAKHEARESEQEHQDRKAEENRDIAKLISGIGILPKGA